MEHEQDKSNEAQTGQLRQADVSGSALLGIRSKVIQAAADCVMKMNVSEEPGDWVKGRIGVKDARRIRKGAEHVNELNRRMAIRLRDIADELLSHCHQRSRVVAVRSSAMCAGHGSQPDVTRRVLNS